MNQTLAAPASPRNPSLAAVAAARSVLNGSDHSHRIASIVAAMPEAQAALRDAGFPSGEFELFLAEDEGWACWYRPLFDGSSGPGCKAGPAGCDVSAPWLFDADAWEDYHAGHEATPAYLLAARDAANDEIVAESDASWARRAR